jgi:uncharacterized protein (DUF433 family)/DNA-binding transcriptional MerR regulator
MNASPDRRSLLGRGLYSYARAAALTGATPQSVRRWLLGYDSVGSHRGSVVPLELPRIDDETSVSFLNLVEIRLIRLLRDKGVSLHRIREAADYIAREHGVRQPLAWSGLRTDGRDVFLRLGDDCVQASGRRRGNLVMERVLEAYLQSLEFTDDGLARRWYPDQAHGGVMVDPHYLFGEPALTDTRLSTRVLLGHALAGDSPSSIAEWYGLSIERVECALSFERSIAAA